MVFQLLAENPDILDQYNIFIAGGGKRKPTINKLEDVSESQRKVYVAMLQNMEKYPALVGKVVFLGFSDYIQEIPNAYRMIAEGFDKYIAPGGIFCNPSLHEPFGLGAIEAMASKLLVLSTSRGGPSEIITNGQDGFLFDPYDLGALAGQLRTIMHLTAVERARIIDQAQAKIVKMFSWDNTAKKISQLYASLIPKSE
jgi:glycosyltransferase involved in cell wall biosynthesis